MRLHSRRGKLVVARRPQIVGDDVGAITGIGPGRCEFRPHIVVVVIGYWPHTYEGGFLGSASLLPRGTRGRWGTVHRCCFVVPISHCCLLERSIVVAETVMRGCVQSTTSSKTLPPKVVRRVGHSGHVLLPQTRQRLAPASALASISWLVLVHPQWINRR